MNQNIKSAMLAAAGLTAAGDLNAATALIQRALAGDLPAASAGTAGTAGTAGSAWGAAAGRKARPATRGDVIDVEASWLPESRSASATAGASATPAPSQATADAAETAAGSPTTAASDTAAASDRAAASDNAAAGEKAAAAEKAAASDQTAAAAPEPAAPWAGAARDDGAARGAPPARQAGATPDLRPAEDVGASPPVSRQPDWQAFAANIISKATAFPRADAGHASPDWQAFAADMAAAAAAFPHLNADQPTGLGPDTAPSHGGDGRVISGTSTAPAGSRDYQLYLPPGEAPSTGRPLVVMLHGCTQSPADFAAGTAMNRLADRHGFVVLYPAQSKAANQSACWNWFNPRDQRAGGGEPSIIAGMVRDVADRHGIEPGRINVAGLSAGGAMAAILAEAYPDLFSAVAVHSGLPSGAAHDLPSALSAMKRGSASPGGAGEPAGGFRPRRAGKPVRTIVFHGRQDKTVHPGNGRQVVEAALSGWPADALVARREEGRSAGGRSFIRTVHADAAGKPMVEQWEVQGAGHAWFGGSALGSYTDPKGPDASAAMVAFFQIG